MNILYSTEQLQKFRDEFVSQIKAAQEGKQSSLFWNQYNTPTSSTLKPGEKFNVMAIGGSNFHGAIGYRDEHQGKVILESVNKVKLPLFDTAKSFFDFIADQYNPVYPKLALNFAYALQPIEREGRLDGVMQLAGKDHKFTGLIGQKVAESLEKYLLSKFQTQVQCAVANDTFCSVLAGFDAVEPSAYNTLVGGVIGTGINFATFIGNSIVNLEGGEFTGFKFSESGVRLQPELEDHFILEYEVAGAYLYRHFNMYNKLYQLGLDEIGSTQELSKIASGEISFGETAELHNKAKILAISLLKRSASLAAVEIAGIYAYKEEQGISQLNFVMEGSLFWEGYEYRNSVKEYLNLLEVEESAINFLHVPQSYLVGASFLI